MPYLASNQDARQQEQFKTAMMGAAVVFGAAAIGAGSLSKLAKKTSASFSDTSRPGIAKKLYNNYGKLDDGVISGLNVRNNSDIAEQQMKRYKMGKTITGKDRLYRKDAGLFESFKDNYLNKDVRAFNQTIGDYKKGNFGNDVYGKSKASLYNDLYDRTQKAGIGMNSSELSGLTNDIYKSDAVSKLRPDGWSMDDDVAFTNQLWRDEQGATRRYRSPRGSAKAGRTSGNMDLAKTDDVKRNDIARAGERKMRADDVKRIERAQLKAQPGDPLASKKPGGIKAENDRRKAIREANMNTINQSQNELTSAIGKATPVAGAEPITATRPNSTGKFERPQARTKAGKGSHKASWQPGTKALESDSQLVKDLENIRQYRQQLDARGPRRGYKDRIGPVEDMDKLEARALNDSQDRELRINRLNQSMEWLGTDLKAKTGYNNDVRTPFTDKVKSAPEEPIYGPTKTNASKIPNQNTEPKQRTRKNTNKTSKYLNDAIANVSSAIDGLSFLGGKKRIFGSMIDSDFKKSGDVDQLIRDVRKEYFSPQKPVTKIGGNSNIHDVVNADPEYKNSPEGIKNRKRSMQQRQDRKELAQLLDNNAMEKGNSEDWALKRFAGTDENDLVPIFHGGSDKTINKMLTHGKGYQTLNDMQQGATISKQGLMAHSQTPQATMKYTGRGEGSPAVLSGMIPRKYLVANNLTDEFSVPQKHFDKIQNRQIHRPGDKQYDEWYKQFWGTERS